MDKELYEKIVNDLKNDFPDITISLDGEDIIINANSDDVLWEIFEVLYNGVSNIEFNASKDEYNYLILNV
ncbi:MAG: hypothetical protein LUG89_05290 [Methanosphaera sp.]|nr:hypothetical protein [Methanosphaera sp.]